MALVDSLLTAMVRANGDALVMHVGERPYVVTSTGTIDLSTHALNLEAMTGMLAQLLPADSQSALREFGAVEHQLPSRELDRFTVVAARGGDDIWIEIRRRRGTAAAAAAAPAQPAPPVEAAAPPPPAEVAASPPPMEVATPPAPVDEPVVAEEPIAIDEPAVAEEPIAIDEPVVVEEPVLVDEPVVAEEPVLPDEPVVAEEPVVLDEPAAEEPLVVEAPMLAAETEDDRLVLDDAGDDDTIDLGEIASLEDERLVLDVPLTEAIRAPMADAEDEWAFLAPLSPTAPMEAPVAAEPPAEEPARAEIEAAPAEPEPAPVQSEIEPAPMEPEPAPVEAEAEPVQAEIEPQPAEPEPAPMQAEIEPAPAQPEPAPMQAEAEPAPARPEPVHEEAASIAREPVRAPVLPLTRTVRIEVPARAQHARIGTVERLLRVAAARGASSLFLTPGSAPYLRVEGDIRLFDSEPVQTSADVDAAVLEIGPPNAREIVEQPQAEWIVELADVGRVRCTTFTDHRGPGVIFNLIATRAATAEQLALPGEVQALATEAEGLVLVAGPRGGGKSTLMSALVDQVNRQRAEYVMTFERQIRLVHENRQALVSQREIRGGADEALLAVRAGLRENPDVLVVDDLTSAQMVPLLLEAAGQGLLVLVSITAPSTTEAVGRLIDLAPRESRKDVQAAMAETFRGAVAQVLVKKTGGGRVAAREVLLGTAAVTRLMAEGQVAQLPLALEGGRKHGMTPLTDALLGLVQSGVVDIREAFRKTPDRDRLLAGLKRQGIDTSVVDRLA